MVLNLIKKYADLLDIHSLGETDRLTSLRRIFDRDITNNEQFKFREKRIFPFKADGEDTMATLFKHLTSEEVIEECTGRKYSKRIYDSFRSERLHWVRCHTEEIVKDCELEIFSLIERDTKKRKDLTRTYIYNRSREYVVVLEPQYRGGSSYYLLTAFFLHKKYGEKQMEKKIKERLIKIL